MTPRDFASKATEKTRQEALPHVSTKVQYYHDPYLAEMPPDEVAMCTNCHNVYAAGVWKLERQASDELAKAGCVHETLCPACKKTKDQMPGGVVTLAGRFLKEHEEEIINLINHENRSAQEINPLERVMSTEKQDSAMTVLTTNEKLAQRIGKAISRAYDGEVEYKWSKGTKLARVNWHRD